MRVLVVDDQPAIREYLIEVLADRAIVPELAVNGAEAQELLRENTYDVVFLDWTLPRVSGMELLQGIARGDLKRPAEIAFTSAADALADVASGTLPIGRLLAKPFAIAEIDAVLARAERRRIGVGAHVFLVGAGEWLTQTARVVRRRCGTVGAARSARQLADALGREASATLVVVGPPLDPGEFVAISAIARERPGMVVFAAHEREQAFLRSDLLRLGVSRLFELPRETYRLVPEILDEGGAACRNQLRVPFVSAVRLTTPDASAFIDTEASDLSEGGLGLRSRVQMVLREGTRVRVQMDVGGAPVVADAVTAWSVDLLEGKRFGLRFERVEGDGLSRVRQHIANSFH